MQLRWPIRNYSTKCRVTSNVSTTKLSLYSKNVMSELLNIDHNYYQGCQQIENNYDSILYYK